jgi:surfeit locus 1 family protein
VKALLHARLVNLNIGLYQFNPGIITTIITAGLLYIMLWMGMWQWEKGEFRQNLEQTVAARKDLAPIDWYLLPAEQQQWKYLPVQISGRFDNARQFLRDNRIVAGRAGYDVYTPFITNSGEVLLLNRGWLPQGRTRQDLPDIEVTQQEVTITGLVDSLPEKGVILADNVHQANSWPRVLQYLDIAEMNAMTGYTLLDKIVWLKPDTDYGYYREYPSVDLQSAKNTGYAFQWFAMSVALSIIYIVVNTKKRKQ